MNQGNPERLGNPVPVGPASPVRDPNAISLQLVLTRDPESTSTDDMVIREIEATLADAVSRSRHFTAYSLTRSPVRDPAPPAFTEANLAARLELVFDELMDGGPGGSCPYANVTDSARFAQVVAGLLWSHWAAVRGVRDPSPPEPSQKAIEAAFQALWGKAPEYESLGSVEGRGLCARDEERCDELDEVLRAAYAVDLGVRGSGVVPPEVPK